MGLCDWSIATVNRCPSFTDAGVCPMGPQKGPSRRRDPSAALRWRRETEAG
jgi:hypothetical protein